MAPRGKRYQGPMVLVWDEADPRSETAPVKLRYAHYASFDDALLQAEHDLKAPAALDRMRAHMGKPDLADDEVPLGEGRRIIGIMRETYKDPAHGVEDVRKHLVWKPKG